MAKVANKKVVNCAKVAEEAQVANKVQATEEVWSADKKLLKE